MARWNVRVFIERKWRTAKKNQSYTTARKRRRLLALAGLPARIVPVPTRFRPKFVTRAQWGAISPSSKRSSDWNSGSILRVHHTVTHDSTPAGVREIQRFHISGRGWADIAYNFLIGKDGTIYEGRGFEVMGAHTYGSNDDPGVAFIGDFTVAKLTRKQKAAYRWLRATLRRRYGVAAAAPHCRTSSTACPGKNVLAALNLKC